MGSALGEPIVARQGVLKYSPQVSWGTAVTPAVAAGIATWNRRLNGGMKRFRGPGSPRIKKQKPGGQDVPWEVNISALQYDGVDLLQLAKRTNGDLTPLTLMMGFILDGASPTMRGEQIQDAKINAMEVNWSAGEDYSPLAVRLSGTGGKRTAVTSGLTQATLAADPVMAWEGVFEVDGSPFPMTNFRKSVEHNMLITRILHGSAPSTGTARLPKYQTPRSETIRGELAVLVSPGTDFQGALQDGKDFEGIFTNANGDETITFSLSDFTYDEEQFGASDAEGEMLYTLPWEAVGWDLVYDDGS